MVKLYALLLWVGLITTVNASSDNCIQSITVNLDSTAIRNLKSIPIQLIPQPVSGHYIQVENLEVNVTSQYTNTPLLIAYHLGSSEGTFFSVGLYSGVPFYSGWPPVNGGEIVADAPVMLTVSDSAIGNGSAAIIVTYRVVSLTGVTMCDTVTNSGGQGGECKQIVNLTSAQILNLHSSPQTLIPAPPAGKYIQVKSIITFYTFNTTAYNINTQLEVFFTDTLRPTGGNVVTLLDTENTMRSFGVNQGGASYAMASPLKIRTKNGDPVSGDGDIELLITYEVVDSGVDICSGVSGALPYVMDSVVDLSMDTVELQLNKTNIVVAQGAATNIVFIFPNGTDGDIIQIINTQQLTNAIPQGAGTSTLTVWRLLQMAKDPEMTLRCVGSNWY